MTSREQARLGWHAPLSEIARQTGEFNDVDVQEAIDRQFADNDQEDSISPENVKIGTQEEPKRFVTQDNRRTEGGVMTPDLPKAKTSLFFQEMAVYYNVRSQWNATLPDANLHPVVALQLDSMILSVYNIIRRAIINDKEKLKEMDGRIRYISDGCQAIGKWVVINGGDDTQILLDRRAGPWYASFLNYIKNTWSELFDIMGRVDLGLHFEIEKEWKKKAKGKRGDITHLISNNDALMDEEVEKRAKARLEQMLKKPTIIEKKGDGDDGSAETGTPDRGNGNDAAADSPADEGDAGVEE